MLKEFRDFAVKGNVIDMGVGIVIGAAFTTIVTSFVKDILNPILGVITGGIDFSQLFINLSSTQYDTLAAAQEAGAPTINYGVFINAIISFVIVAFVLFQIVRNVNKLKAQFEKKQEEAAAAPAAPPAQELLLTEIRDLLKNR